ncbi:3'(2'),5'-bisphosphate nucleotidase CysQ [Mesorhizobium sp. NBSH29]|uniref:3'(2'),5'-bisphosphate nucleotidase CysQ n=1 Tax=Mesorhizobium sp. NBSH29 TaxID=2654249 RepID=UPI0018966FCC|nr:3'(2'),5'-bisphosphate nucleotidase CysQ [Mesorhizobium sp. NBSH29]QPC87061.1 3'(2'),5'-bisphosphate nucleotidase CysQ [Mesorhizobium sp. NBSH29]
MKTSTTIAAAASDDSAILALFEELAIAAGKVVLDVFHTGCAVDHKQDLSPVTAADRDSEVIILAGLRQHLPHIPCVAEEESAAGICPTDIGDTFILIDPLDGTKEFVNRNSDFTVNIALVRNGVPVVGAVFAPISGKLYLGRPGLAELVMLDDGFAVVSRRRIAARKGFEPLTIVASRSHRTPETDDFILGHKNAEIVSVGSSLKFCLIAAAEADLYPRFGPTMEWDTAAGDAVLRAAGGSTQTVDGKPLTYGKRGHAGEKDFANPAFISRGLVVEAVTG